MYYSMYIYFFIYICVAHLIIYFSMCLFVDLFMCVCAPASKF